MKKYVLAIVAVILAVSAMASTSDKKSYLYAVKGTDSLYLDHYVSSVSGKRPCNTRYGRVYTLLPLLERQGH